MAFQGKPLSAGWAKSAGVIGLIGGGLALALGMSSFFWIENIHMSFDRDGGNYHQDYKDYNEPFLLFIAPTLIWAALGPVVEAGASSAAGSGSPRARVVGWIAYALTLASSIGISATYWNSLDSEFSSGSRDTYCWVILGTATIGTLSMLLFSVDAFTSASQAKKMIQKSSGLTMAPTIVPIGRESRIDGAALGLVGRF
jgi:hypothetical protein